MMHFERYYATVTTELVLDELATVPDEYEIITVIHNCNVNFPKHQIKFAVNPLLNKIYVYQIFKCTNDSGTEILRKIIAVGRDLMLDHIELFDSSIVNFVLTCCTF